MAQELEFLPDNIDFKTSLKSLRPFLDAYGINRVRGRLHNANLNFPNKFPIILTKHCNVAKLIIRQEHLILMYGGLRLALKIACYNNTTLSIV